MSDAKDIAMQIFPEDWITSGDFKTDRNAGRRGCAEIVADYFLEVLKRERTANSVMMAFYRREHHGEPTEEQAKILACHMGTALLAYEVALKNSAPTNGCEHNMGLTLCDKCAELIS